MIEILLAALASPWLGALLALPFLGKIDSEYWSPRSIMDIYSQLGVGTYGNGGGGMMGALEASLASDPGIQLPYGQAGPVKPGVSGGYTQDVGSFREHYGPQNQWMGNAQLLGYNNQSGTPLAQQFSNQGYQGTQFYGNSNRFSGGGNAGSSSNAGAPSGANTGGAPGSLQPETIEPLQMGPRTFTASVGGAPSTGYTITGQAAAGAATAPSTGAAGWFKTLMGNQRLITSVVGGVATLYGQYDKKKQAGKEYEAMQRELDARRAYEQQKIAAYQNSPAARMAPTLMKMVADIYGKRLNKHGVQFDAAAFIQQMFGGA